MKRGITTFLFVLIVSSLLFASFDYKLELLSLVPTFEEEHADRSRAAMDIQYACVYDGYPVEFYQNQNKFTLKEEKAWRFKPFFGVLHLGETVSVLRNTFSFDSVISPISFGIEMEGSMTNVMEGRISDTIGYDGVYSYCFVVGAADVVALRFGGCHYCSHYGDGTYKYMEPGESVTLGFQEWFKYLRMDSLIAGISIRPIEVFRLYGNVIFDTDTTLIKPEIFRPGWSESGSSVEDVPSSYKHMIISCGFDLEYPVFKNLGNTRLSYQMKAYEEGKIVYKEEDLTAARRVKPFYDPDRPWEFEHTINLSQEINDLVSFDVTWHVGRFISNMYYSTRSRYIAIGARLDFDGSVTLVDTSK